MNAVTRGLTAVGIALVLNSTLSARELVANGDFELGPVKPWQWDTFGFYSDSSNCHLWSSTYFQPDLDREIGVHKILHQWAMLSQTVPVTELNLQFSASAKLFCKTERPDNNYFACACIALEYLDEKDIVLGETRIYSRTGGCPWVNTPTLHLILAPDTNRWHNYSLNITDELSNLPGVERNDIQKIRIALWSYCNDNC